MDSTSVSSFVASFQFNEIDYFAMLIMTFFLGWQIGETVRLRFKKLPNLKLPKSKASKLSHENKIWEGDTTVVRQVKHPAVAVQINQKGTRRISPARVVVHKPDALEQLASETTAPPGLQPPPGLPPARAPSPQAKQDTPWRKLTASVVPDAPQEDTTPRQLGRVVCWKETGYGFIVDEAGQRLFVRQAEVEGGEQLRAGQLIRFRRGKSTPGQAAKALNVTIVSQEEARVMRKPASRSPGSSPKVTNKALAFPSASTGGGADCPSGRSGDQARKRSGSRT